MCPVSIILEHPSYVPVLWTLGFSICKKKGFQAQQSFCHQPWLYKIFFILFNQPLPNVFLYSFLLRSKGLHILIVIFWTLVTFIFFLIHIFIEYLFFIFDYLFSALLSQSILGPRTFLHTYIKGVALKQMEIMRKV